MAKIEKTIKEATTFHVELSNFAKLKSRIATVEKAQKKSKIPIEFWNNPFNISAIEKHCGIKNGSLSRALSRGQLVVPFDDKLSKLLKNETNEY